MSAQMVRGKRSYFEEQCESSSSLVMTKKLRCSCSTVTSSLVDRLIELYPNIHKQLLEKALQENDNDVDSVVTSFNQLCLGHVERNCGFANAATGEKYVENSSAHCSDPVTNCSQQQTNDQALTRENVALKKLVTTLMRVVISKDKREKDLKKEVSTLKQMLSTYEERQKDYDNKTQEIEHLKKEASRWKLEKYAMQLKQAQVGSSMPGRCHPDVF